MSGVSSAALSRDIQVLFDTGTVVGLTDRQLLDRFGDRRDPAAGAAFEALVRRHGPMVLRVCHNALLDPNDAEDAFQATFLVLVRRCGALKGLDSLGGWLYGVACRVAARARVEAAKRRAVEGRAALRVVEAVEPADADEIDRDELGPIVQGEVRRLPEKYRAAVVLCYWEGLTQEQAAAQLGCPLGTVRSRLARARDLLRRRLARRGLAPMAVGMDATAGSIRRLPPIAPELVQSTVQAAVRVAAGQATNRVVSVAVASLIQRILWRTTMIKLGGIAAGVILVGLAGYGAGLAAQRSGDAGASRLVSSGPQRPTVDPGRSTGKGQSELEPIQGEARPKEGKTSPSQVVYANVEGVTRILSIVPDRAQVKKGTVVCVLDPAPFRDRLVDQRIVVKTAEAAFLNAKLTREVAEMAVREYFEGDYVAQLADVQGNIQLAQAELALAEEELKAVNESRPRVAFQRAEVAVLRARFALEKSQSRKELLVKYARERKIKELESAVKKAQADELARRATWELMAEKEQKLERQIAACTITAPMDGRVRYIDSQGFAPGMGNTVHSGVRLMTIEPVNPSAATRDPEPAKRGGPLR